MHVGTCNWCRPTRNAPEGREPWRFGYSPGDLPFSVPALRHSSYLRQRIVPSSFEPLTNDCRHRRFLSGGCPSQFDAAPLCERHVRKAGIPVPDVSKFSCEAFHALVSPRGERPEQLVCHVLQHRGRSPARHRVASVLTETTFNHARRSGTDLLPQSFVALVDAKLIRKGHEPETVRVYRCRAAALTARV